MTHIPCKPPELRTLFLFEHLTDHQLDQLCENGYRPGSVVIPGFTNVAYPARVRA